MISAPQIYIHKECGAGLFFDFDSTKSVINTFLKRHDALFRQGLINFASCGLCDLSKGIKMLKSFGGDANLIIGNLKHKFIITFAWCLLC